MMRRNLERDVIAMHQSRPVPISYVYSSLKSTLVPEPEAWLTH